MWIAGAWGSLWALMAPSSKAEAEAANSADGEVPFEVALERLEAVVQSLEGGEIELEVALARFEEGVRLVGSCTKQLETAERRIEALVEEAGGLVARPFDLAGDDGEEFEDSDGEED